MNLQFLSYQSQFIYLRVSSSFPDLVHVFLSWPIPHVVSHHQSPKQSNRPARMPQEMTNHTTSPVNSCFQRSSSSPYSENKPPNSSHPASNMSSTAIANATSRRPQALSYAVCLGPSLRSTGTKIPNKAFNKIFPCFQRQNT